MLTRASSWIKLVLLILLLSWLVFVSKKSSSKFINPLVSPDPSVVSLPSPSLAPSPTPSPSPSPTPQAPPQPLPTPTPSPSPQAEYSQEEIHSFFEKYSNEYHVDINILRHIAVCESGFDPKAVNLNYAGLFQFSSSIWSHYRNLLNQNPNPDLRTDAQEAVKTAAYILSINHAYIWPNCVPD